MDGQDARGDDLLAAIGDPLLRERVAVAFRGGPALAEREVFEAAAGVSDAEVRRAFVAAACGADERKRRAVEALLDADRAETAAVMAPLIGQATPPVIWPAADSRSESEPGGRRPPDRIGRYRIQKLLGSGSFGAVWLGYDDELDRPVAVKVPRGGRIDGTEAAESFVAEARFAAGLSHAHIVPVHDIGRLDDGSVYVVSRFIAGPPLRAILDEGRVPFEESARVIATVARALHHAHERGVIHRDVTPRNILVEEKSGTPFVTDFGVAVAQARSLADTRIAGTPAYMSPEQAKGEAHRLDGRSDVFALGAILYEMLTGRRAFHGSTTLETLEAVATHHPPPPCDCDPTVPADLDRICRKALAKRRGDRYASAAALASDLEAWLAGGAEDSVVDLPIEPKGLRSFEAADAGAFLQLLPGPRGRDGLPESLRFWKTRLDDTDPEKTFAIGLLYGPSGCGKSSLVKAGIVPRLGAHVRPIVIEASPDDTESRLERALRKVVGRQEGSAGLVGACAAARESDGPKIVVVLDQFEQWLQAHPDAGPEALVAALRQFDGRRLQALILVRDDFAMSAARFMEAVEVRIEEGRNFATVDLFPADHARSVLVRFGQGLGRLPRRQENMSADEVAFVDAATAGLGGLEHRVVPVQLALFVDLVRTRPWTPATLHDLGAAAGPGRLLDRVGVAFLEDSFNSRSATPSHKLHAAGAKRVLEALLPDAGAAIRGHKRSTPDLRSLSGYDARPADFLNLLRILDGELRLVTPTDPPAGDSASGAAATSGTAYYQLTHDYLVPALREWLSGDRRRSAKGRAELALAERTAFWSARNETQQLPTLAEWVQIRWLTRPSDWRPAQRRMMGRADRVHGSRVAAAALVALVATLGGLAARGRVVTRQLALEADGAVRTLLAADVAAIPAALEPLARHRDRVVPVLREVVADDADDGRTLRATLGLAALAGAGGSAGDEPAFALLAGRLPVAEPDEVAVIVDRLAPRAEEFAERYRGEASDPAGGPRRLRAAAALAAHGTGGDVWSGIAAGLAEELVDVPTVHLATWLEALRGVRAALVPAVVDVFRDPARREVERSRAADILADYAADDPAVLAAVATTAEPRQFATLAGAVGKVFDRVAPILEGVVTEALPVGVPASAPEREHLAIRQAKAAAVLLRYGRPERVWPMFVHTPDPRVRSELMHFVKPFAGEALADTAAALADRLGAERDVSAKRALVLTLGDVVAGADAGGETLGEVRARVVPIIRQIFETDPDPGLHAAAEWTLRQWGERPRIRPHRGAGLAADPPRLAATRAELVREGGRPAHWYVNAHGQTLVVVAGPVAFTMGSPETEEDHLPNERQRDVRIAASFAIGATPVTRAQYQSVIGAPQAMVPYVLGKMGIDTGGAKGDDVPMVGITWLEAAAYCNKLGRAEGLPEDQLVYMESAPGGAVSGIHADHASRTGYRLPTEAEWEFTVRAGAVTSRPYGETTRLLGEYAIFGGQVEEAGPVGARKPNDLGLFDGLGNVWTWTQDLYDDTVSGGVDHGPVTPDQQRAKRGGDYRLAGRQIRVAFRNFDRSDRADINAGFRIARTIAPLPDETRPRAEPRPAPERNTGAR